MNQIDFQKQMGRLQEAFGKAHYNTERCQLLWRELQSFSAAWFSRTVDNFLLSSRHAPLPIDFKEPASLERERQWKLQKEKTAQDAHDFWAGTYHSDEIKEICSTIRKRMSGQVNDEDWGSFTRLLRAARTEI